MSTASESGFRMPAEFEEQSAVWLGWPTFQWYSDPCMDTREPIAKIIKALSDHGIKTQIMCTDSQGEIAAKAWLTNHGYYITAYMAFPHINQVDIWVRDFGPIFVRNNLDELAIVGFKQDQWGYSTTSDPISKAMTEVPGKVAEGVGIQDFLVSVVSEGGSRIVNGKGTLLVNRIVEYNRNPQLSEAELDAVFKSSLGVSKVIWLNIGVHEDLHATWGPIPYVDATGKDILLYGPQTTGGHLDEFVRFATPNKIILVQVTVEEAACDPIAAANYPRLEEAYRILAASTDQDGKPFEIIRIPSPDIEYRLVKPGEEMYSFLKSLSYPASVPQFPTDNRSVYVVKPSSYANYLISNGVVIMPKYGGTNTSKDAEAAKTLGEAYSREVVQIDADSINYCGGGIHCATQQQPIGKMIARKGC